MKHSSIPFSFAFLLAGVLALSGVFVTRAIAQDEQPIPEEAVFESSVVADALAFVAEQGTETETEATAEVSVKMESFSSVESSSKKKEEKHDDQNCPTPEDHTPLPVKLVVTKIKCASESDLPNFGLGGPDITAETASNFLASHPSCSPVKSWGFEWGNQNVTNPGDDFLWEAAPANGWKSLGRTNADGVLSVEVPLPSGTTEIRVREVLEPGYLPFSYGASGNKNTNNVSAELYCSNDVINYDNFDFVRNPVAGKTYHCVAWNVRASVVNHPPIITLVGANPVVLTVGETFTDQGATATDVEDGVLTPVVTGSVNAALPGTYTLTYTATDSGGLSASTTRTVTVLPLGPKPACADGLDNDTPADGMIDFPADAGCSSATDTDENNPPVITLIGETPMTLVVGSTFTDLGATATDAEDGTLTPVVTGTVVSTTTGSYTIVYTATDSKGLSASTSRTVNVIPAGPATVCSDGIDNDGDSAIDFPADAGCSSLADNDENNAPIITLIGGNPIEIVIGNTFTDPGASSTDQEDGDLTSQIVATGTANTTVLGSYTITYSVSDSDGLSASTSRTVNVVPAPVNPPPGGGGGGGTTPPKCANGQDDDADGKADYPADPGCTDSLDNDETDTPPGGGGGAGSPGLQIFNEKLTVLTSSSVKITWNTNLLSDSRVVYSDLSKNPVGAAPQYGYPNTTATATAATSSHEMTITGLPENAVTFFRPVSSNGGSTVVGIELVTPAVAGSCTYLEKYMRLGYSNDPVEVTKLQRFLKEYEGFKDLAVTGIFDITTDKAVRAFQDKYASEVLTPWGLPGNTGYVYYTTKKKVNEIYCQKAFPLDSAQLMEIAEYANVSRGVTTGGSGISSGSQTSQPRVTVVTNPVIDLSKIDLSEMAPKTPVTTLEPENSGEIASGVSTDEANTAEEKSWLSKLIAALPIDLSSDSADEGTTTASAEKATTSSLLASAAASAGVSSGTFLVWIILFAAIIVLGYIMAKRNRVEA